MKIHYNGTVITSNGAFDVSNYCVSQEAPISRVDHANVFYQIPAEENGLPMVFLPGYGQPRRTCMNIGAKGLSDEGYKGTIPPESSLGWMTARLPPPEHKKCLGRISGARL